MKNRILQFILLAVIIVPFQNCSKVNFELVDPSSTLSSESPVDSSGGGSGDNDDPTDPRDPANNKDTLVETSMNTPVEFKILSNLKNLESATVQIPSLKAGMAKGHLEVLESATLKMKYTPSFGFRGRESLVASVTEKSGRVHSYNIIVIVGNTLRGLEPALAVRGMGCISCHAQVTSNILTDFGHGDNYFFSTAPRLTNINGFSGSVYGDHIKSMNSMVLPGDKSVSVPRAQIPGHLRDAAGVDPASTTPAATLAEYIRSRFSLSLTAGTKQTRVVEKETLYIGAPTEADITSSFQMRASDRFLYFKDSDTSASYSGLSDRGNFFHNMGVLKCEGDLALRGPLLLDNVVVESKTGCRLYVIGSVFIYGPITYSNKQADSSLQITSTKSISLGLGSAKRGDAFCSPSDPHALDPAQHGTSSLTNRYVTFWTVPGYLIRQSADPVQFGRTVVAEAELIQSKMGVLYDATCRPETQAVSYDRLLLNAPMVQSRYKGNFSGTVIAEISLMSLGQFKFSFDTVFNRVPVLPFLKKSTYLDVKD